MSYASLKCVLLQTGQLCLSSRARHPIPVLAGSASYRFQVFGGLPPKLFQGLQVCAAAKCYRATAHRLHRQPRRCANPLKKHRLLAVCARRLASITSASCGTPSAPHMRALNVKSEPDTSFTTII